MAFHETTLWAVSTLVLLVEWAVFVYASLARMLYAPRTRGRYLAATLGWATLYPSVAYLFVMGVEAVAQMSLLRMLSVVFQAATWAIWRWLLINDKDDHWFRNLRSRTRRFVRNMVASWNPTPVRVPVHINR